MRRIPLVLVLVCALGGCGIEVEVQTSPDPVVLGEDVTFDITIKNFTECPLNDFPLVVFPLFTAQQKADFQQDLPPALNLDAICEAIAAGVPPIVDPNDIPTPTTLGVANAGGTSAPATGATCMEAMEMGITTLFCTVPGLAPGSQTMVTLMRPANSPGTLFSFLGITGGETGVCSGGTQAGEACNVDGDCDSNDCAPGVCVAGDQAGNGCEMDAECTGGGDCVDCAACPGEGVCTGDNAGTVCGDDSDCPNGECFCGFPFACDEVEVITPTATSTATATNTATATPAAPGDACGSDSQCLSTFCVDGVCCDRECGEPLEVCNLAGEEGTCTAVSAPAPATSPRNLIIALFGLAMIGAIGIQRLRARG